MCGVFAEVLGVGGVGIDDDFFDLGGDSIVSIQLVTRARNEGLLFTTRDVFTHRTVAALATAATDTVAVTGQYVPSDGPLAEVTDDLRAAHPDLEEVLPLSPLQEGLYFHARFAGDGVDAYHLQTPLEISGALSPEVMRRAAAALLERHPNVRSAFVRTREGRLRQVASAGVPLPWTETDLSHLPDGEQHAELWRLLAADRLRRFDLDRPPLVRFTLARLGADRHVLCLTAHHLLLDGWSLPLLLRDLFQLYAWDGDGAALPPPPPYRDHLRWLADQDRPAAERVWRAALAGLDTPTLVAPDTSRALDVPARRLVRELPEHTTRALTAAARGHGLTLNTVVQGVWALVLGALTGRQDVVFGGTVSGRAPQLPDVEDIVGLLINTVPVRVRWDHSEDFAEILVRLQDEQSALTAAQHLGLPEIQQLAGAGELFDTAVSFENAPLDQDGVQRPVPGLRIELLPDPEPVGATHYPLNLVVTPGRRLRLELDHRPDAYGRDDTCAVLGRVVRLLEAFANDSHTPVGRLDLLAADERALVLERWNDTARPVPAAGAAELFEAQARRTPDAPALVCAGTTIHYAELDTRATLLARQLVALGARPEDRVALLHGRSTELVVAMLAVLKAGCAYVPLDDGAPAGRLTDILRETGAHILLTDRAPDRLPFTHDGAVLRTGSPSGTAPAVPLPAAHPEQLAYVMHTSGSTGEPKGVMATHRDIVALATDARWDPERHARVLFHSPHAFDASTYEIWAQLLSGRCVVVAPPGPTDVRALRSVLREGAVTALWLTAGLFRAVAGEDPSALRGVQEMWTGGDVVPSDAVERVMAACPGLAVVDGYGPTETTTFATSHTVPAGQPVPRTMPIGRPLANTRVYVLDAALRPVPPGALGEIWIAGAGLARGYLGRPGLTAERFTADPFGGPGGRMYRTGDLGRWAGDGVLHYAGRSDDQVKVRGFRIEPGEIETALAAADSVGQAVVTAREDPPGGRRLVAYLVPEAGQPLDEAALRDHLARLLPAYMVPAAFVTLDAFPLTVNGKVDRRALPAPRFAAAADSRPPRTPNERLLCTLFAEVLGLDHVGIDDNFFELGGDSIISIQLVSRAGAAGLELTPQDVFTHPTVEALAGAGTDPGAARAVGEQPGECGPLVRLEPAETARLHAQWGERGMEDVLPLSPLQEGIFFHALYSAGGVDVYNVQTVFGITGPLVPEQLRAACAELLARHHALRAGFAQTDGGRSVQIVPERTDVPWTTVDLTSSTGDDLAQERRRLLAEDRAARFDLGRPPLVRFTLVRTADDRHELVFTSHHIVMDGWSLPLVMRDLFALYARGSGGPDLPAVVPYRGYLSWIAGQDTAAAEAAWREALAGLEEPTLLAPGTDPDGGVLPEREVLTLPRELTEELGSAARAAQVTVNSVVQTAWGALLSLLTGRRDVVFGATVSGRPPRLPGVEDMVGMLINTVPVRVTLDPAEPLGATVARVQREQAALSDHHHVGLAAIQRAAGTGELFDTMTVFENYPLDRAAIRRTVPGLRITPEQSDASGATHYPVALVVQPGEEMRLELEFRPDVYDRDTVRGFATRLRLFLTAFAADPSTPLGRVALLEPAERVRVLREWNDTVLAVPKRTLPELFAAQVGRTPDAIAASFRGRQVSYAELDDRVGRFAAVLRAEGAGPGDVVAVSIRPSLDLLVALYAVHRSGAAYLPVDPGYPKERARRILEDTAAVLVVTEDRFREMAVKAEAAEPVGVPAALTPLHPAYVIHTSGSTGRPKSIVVSHAGVANYLAWMQDRFPLGSRDRVLHKTSINFDPSVWELFWPSANGACVVIADPEVHGDPGLLTELIRREGVTVAQFVPSTLELFVAAPQAAACVSLRRVFCGGEVLTGALAERFRTTLGAELHNLYGPTEVSVYSTSHRVGAGGAAAVPVGCPAANLRVYVLDGALRPVPPGVVGEIHIAGDGVTPGYAGRPDLTAERFVPDPFGPPGTRMYRTGDLGRWSRQGVLHYSGRSDAQLKIRGFRIELDEVRAVLDAAETVRQAVVLAREDQPGIRRLVAYVVLDPDACTADGPETPAADAEAALREHVARHLPEYMVPSAVVVMDALPLNPNGKVDRKALPAPEGNTAGSGRPPRGERERVLCELFADVLGLDRVGADDSFFDLGGDSIIAVQLVARARARGLVLTPRSVFTARTAAELAHVAAEEQPEPAAAPRGALVSIESDELAELEAQWENLK